MRMAEGNAVERWSTEVCDFFNQDVSQLGLEKVC